MYLIKLNLFKICPSLTELMVIVAIIGILVALMLPANCDYAGKATVVASLQEAESLQNAVTAYWHQHHRLPQDRHDIDWQPSPDTMAAIDSLAWTRQGIMIHYSDKAVAAIAGKQLHLQPALQGTQLIWICGLAERLEGVMVSEKNQTSVPAKHLPPSCR